MALITAILGFIVGGAVFFIWGITKQRKDAVNLEAARAQAEEIAKEAQTRSQLVVKEAELKAKDMVVGAKADAEREMRDRRREIAAIEQKLEAREETFEKRQEAFERREADLNRRDQSLRSREKSLTDKEEVLQAHIDEARTKLEAVAGLTREEAKRSLMDEMIGQARTDAAKHIRIVEEEAREEADRRAKRVVAIAIERLAGEFVAERTVSVIALPNDEMKGRIIGREGRNIRAIEAATGVDIIIDDTPEAVVISCHNPIRREIARVALMQLISDGRIHPGRIEEVVRKAEQQVEESIREAGQRAIIEVGVHGIHPELVKLLGMLKYRYSYAQNVLMHSIEAAFICGAMAAELGLNEKQARRAALLHDIGKALTHEVEGSHALIGGEIARKYGESAKIVNAIAAHHEEVKAETILAPLVDAADALSGARPGARREVLESYVKRLEDLETIAKSFKGVEKCFAVQAGREMRVIVEPSQISDEDTSMLARDVARKIETDMTYPGQIRVTVIRETRATELAK
ncbi:MAG TPA: ribonuclease Y [Candidatus Binatus sp.]|uniref:ribonuclease Y n=1 Tax=Candidatus Binatus sp. TaxID=2811406 RepID=UPI002B49662F|nr:ribonuclease Y [Candidatus Binatus sp.]HKN12996.1 ribonuclease Y [Candidatus Binatus sp.]